MPLQIRRGTDAERTAMTVPLATGELIYITDQQRIYVGDGATLGGIPVTGYTNENAVDAVGAALAAGSHTNITFTYGSTQDTANRIDATVNLSSYTGTIGATAVNSNIVANDTTVLVNVSTGSINLNGTVKGNVIPNADSTYDLGSASYKFRDLYLSGSSIHLGNSIITSTGTAVNLPAGSTIGGDPIAVPAGGNLNVSIIGDDSTTIINAATKVVTAAGGFVGNLTGNVNGDVTGNLSGTSTGNHVGNVVTSGLAVVVDAANKRATLDELALTSTGLISGSTMTVTTGQTIFLTQTVSATDPLISVLTSTSATADSASIALSRQRGTLVSPSAVLSGDTLGKCEFTGFDGTDYVLSAGIIGVTDNTVSTNVVPSRLEFKVSSATGTLATAVSIKSTKVEFTAPPKVPVFADTTARNAAIPSPEAGMICFITASTQFQGYNGSTWTALN